MDRSKTQWQETMDEGIRLVKTYLVEADEPDRRDPVESLAAARNEVRRLERDVERYARDAFGITLEQLNEVRL